MNRILTFSNIHSYLLLIIQLFISRQHKLRARTAKRIVCEEVKRNKKKKPHQMNRMASSV